MGEVYGGYGDDGQTESADCYSNQVPDLIELSCIQNNNLRLASHFTLPVIVTLLPGLASSP